MILENIDLVRIRENFYERLDRYLRISALYLNVVAEGEVLSFGPHQIAYLLEKFWTRKHAYYPYFIVPSVRWTVNHIFTPALNYINFSPEEYVLYHELHEEHDIVMPVIDIVPIMEFAYFATSIDIY